MFELGNNEIILDRFKTGLLCAREEGGGMTNTGHAYVVCDSKGGKCVPLYVPKKGQLANGVHAYIPINIGCYIIEASHHRGDFTINVWRVEKLHEHLMPADEVPEGIPSHASSITYVTVAWASLWEEFSFDKGEWDNDPHEFLHNAIHAAMDKAQCYHCAEPHYVTDGAVILPLDSPRSFPQLRYRPYGG